MTILMKTSKDFNGQLKYSIIMLIYSNQHKELNGQTHTPSAKSFLR